MKQYKTTRDMHRAKTNKQMEHIQHKGSQSCKISMNIIQAI